MPDPQHSPVIAMEFRALAAAMKAKTKSLDRDGIVDLLDACGRLLPIGDALFDAIEAFVLHWADDQIAAGEALHQVLLERGVAGAGDVDRLLREFVPDQFEHGVEVDWMRRADCGHD